MLAIRWAHSLHLYYGLNSESVDCMTFYDMVFGRIAITLPRRCHKKNIIRTFGSHTLGFRSKTVGLSGNGIGMACGLPALAVPECLASFMSAKLYVR